MRAQAQVRHGWPGRQPPVQSASNLVSEPIMLQLAAPLFEQNLGYARRLVADLRDDQLTAQPVSGWPSRKRSLFTSDWGCPAVPVA